MTKSGNGAANGWGVNSEYGKLHDVLLCEPVNFKWLPTSSISKATLRSGAKFDQQLAMKQHREMAQAYEAAGVTVHMLEPDEDAALPGLCARFELHDAVRRGRHPDASVVAARRIRRR